MPPREGYVRLATPGPRLPPVGSRRYSLSVNSPLGRVGDEKEISSPCGHVRHTQAARSTLEPIPEGNIAMIQSGIFAFYFVS